MVHHPHPLERAHSAAVRQPDRSAFFGREKDIAAVSAWLASGRRVVTITGPGGMGKTRLAQRVAAALDEQSVVGTTWFCECASAKDAASIVAAAARGLNLVPGAAADLAEEIRLVGRSLAGHRAPLLVMDNVEQVVSDTAELLSAWLAAAPECVFLVTSREVLRLEGESVYELGPLPEAPDLFLDRARLLHAEYARSEAEQRIVAQVVARLDGIPLAVELAAARARVLAPAALLRHLEARIETLAHGPRNRDARQSTMREAIAWSWELLDDREQQAMAALSVFRGGFCLDDAERILGDTLRSDLDEAMELVQALRDKSFLHVVDADSSDGSTRFGMYEVILSFARTQLEERGMVGAATTSHAEHFVDRGEQLLRGCPLDRLEATLDRVALDRENLESVLERYSAGAAPASETISVALRCAVLLGEIAGEDGLSPLQVELLERLLAQKTDGVEPVLLLRARLVQATKRVYSGQPVRAEGECRAIVADAGRLGDDRLTGAAHLALGAALLRQGKAAEAAQVLQQAETLCRQAGDVRGEQHALCQLGGCALSLQQGAEAVGLFQRGLTLARNWGLVRGQVRAEAGLGSHFLEAGDDQASRKHLERCGELARAAGFRRTAILVMGHLGILNFDHDRLGEALECLSAAVAEATETGDDVPEGVFLAAEAAVRATMGDAQGAVPLAARAQRIMSRSALFGLVVEVYGGHVDLALAREAASDPAIPADELIVAAKGRVERARSAAVGSTRFVEQSDDLRVALRILERALLRQDGAESAPVAIDVSVPVLVVGEDTTWFQLGQERRVDMSRRTNSRAILRGLVAHSLAQNPACLSVDELLAIGWPGEKMARSSALNRLYVALATLRSLGLRDVIERRPEGYALSATVRTG